MVSQVASAAIAIGSGTTTVNVLVTAQDGVTTKTYTLSVAPAGALTPQTITFGALSARTFGDAPIALTATASSGTTPCGCCGHPRVRSLIRAVTCGHPRHRPHACASTETQGRRAQHQYQQHQQQQW